MPPHTRFSSSSKLDSVSAGTEARTKQNGAAGWGQPTAPRSSGDGTGVGGPPSSPRASSPGPYGMSSAGGKRTLGPSEGCHLAAPMPVTCGTETAPGWNQPWLQGWNRVHQAMGSTMGKILGPGEDGDSSSESQRVASQALSGTQPWGWLRAGEGHRNS